MLWLWNVNKLLWALDKLANGYIAYLIWVVLFRFEWHGHMHNYSVFLVYVKDFLNGHYDILTLIVFKSLIYGNSCNICRTFLLKLPQGGLEIPLSNRFFAQITPRNCLKFMFTPSLPNHARCQIDIHAITQLFPSNSRFHALKYVK